MPELTTANDMLGALTAGNPPYWISQTALHARPNKYGQLYQSTRAAFYPEVTVRIPTNNKTKRGYAKPQRRRIDLVALSRINYRAWQPLVIGVEIKVTEHDLCSDTKIPDYLPYCDYFYLAVPAEMKAVADARIDADLPGLGLLLLFSGPTIRLVRYPTRTDVLAADRANIFAELLMHQFTRSGE